MVRNAYPAAGCAPWKKAKRSVGRAGKTPPAKSNFNASRRCIVPPPAFSRRLFSLPAAQNQVRRARQSESFTQKFFAHIFQNISGALDPDFSRENRVLILDAENTFEAHVHVGLNDGLPEARAVAVADSSKSL